MRINTTSIKYICFNQKKEEEKPQVLITKNEDFKAYNLNIFKNQQIPFIKFACKSKDNSFAKTKEVSFSKHSEKVCINCKDIKDANIPNLRFISNNNLRGESLSSKKNRHFIPFIQRQGIKNIIDLRDKYTSQIFEELCVKNNLKYYHLPIDSSSVPDTTIIEELPVMFEVLDSGSTYIACAQGLHRTDIALAINYVFNPKNTKKPPIMYGHFRDNEFKFEDIARRLNSLRKKITEKELKELGWDSQSFQEEYEMRKKNLIDFNTTYFKLHKTL